jgi:branched-chain amino acid transport system ATP-binding protein
MTVSNDQVLLDLKNVHVSYGLTPVLFGISMRIHKGEIVAILGPNSAGKSTLICAIAGVLPVRGGEIIFRGRRIHNLMVEQIVRMGITLVPEGRLVFSQMKTLENLEVGAYCRPSRRVKEEVKESLKSVFRLFPVLKQRREQLAGTLSGGEQQMLAIGRGLMSKPELLLLDEPSLGLAPILVSDLMNTLKRLKEEGLTILLSEQNAVAALSIADRAYVIRGGKIVIEGSSEKLRSIDEIKTAYLGQSS